MSNRFPTLVLLASLAVAGSTRAQAPQPQTTAEKSDYKATTRYADVIAFGNRLAELSPKVKATELGSSGEGRAIPLWLIADPPVSQPDQVRGRTVAIVIANIHAGEVDGKEAMMHFSRSLALGADSKLLKNLVIAVVPDFNPDGGEKLGKHRPSQAGPEEVGQRANAAGRDLNRDFVKLETPEVQALARFFRRWDPSVFIDCHTTNGSFHRYTLTYDGPRHPNASPDLVKFVNSELLPEANKRLEKATGFKSFIYGDFSDNHTKWQTYPAQPRYGIQWAGLGNRIAILSESYTYAPFKDRVKASEEFVRACLQIISEKPDQVKAVTRPKPAATIALKTRNAPTDDKVTALGYVEEKKDGKTVATSEKKDYEVSLLTKREAVEGATTTRPWAYLIPSGRPKLIEALQRQGMTVSELREDIDVEAQGFTVEQMAAQNEYQGRKLYTIATKLGEAKAVRAKAGWFMVRTDQKLGNLAATLLEPDSEDGFARWGLFHDAVLNVGEAFPVYRLPKETPLLVTAARPLAEDRKPLKEFNRAMMNDQRPVSLGGNPISGLEWLEDGEHYLQSKDGKLQKVHARTGKPSVFVESAKIAASLSGQPTFDADQVTAVSQQARFQMNPQRTAALLHHGGDLFLVYFDGQPAKRLTKTPGEKAHIGFSPNGKFVSFLRNDNLWVTDVATQTERQLTTDGGGMIVIGKGDWVYEEEIFNRNGKAHWWDPTSSHIAYLRVDDTPVHKFAVVNLTPRRGNLELTPYPKAGDPNPTATVGIASVSGGTPVFPDLSEYTDNNRLIIRVNWLPGGELLIFVSNRVQTWIDVCSTGARGGPLKKLTRLTTQAWVDDPGAPVPLKDGSFLLTSEATGWKQLIRFDKSATAPKPIPGGEWEVRTVHRVDAEAGWVCFSGTKDGSLGENLYRMNLDGSKLERLTPDAGSHSCSVSPKGDLFIDSFSDRATPTRVMLRDMSGKVVRVLDSNPAYAREEYRFGKVEYQQVKMPDGFELESTITYPANFQPDNKYPVWIKTYGGPHSPTVSDSFGGGRVDDQILAGLGVVVFRVDPRSASGKGAKSAWTAYKQLGVQELKDLESAVDWLAKKPWVDSTRIGLSGHSYGGFLTAFALTHSTKFKAGIAGAPVTDWRLYDSIYTERFMLLPQDNPAGYDATSVVKAARKLHGKLLLLHGLMDDNVHVQNSAQFIRELQTADKDFEIMVYPQARHGIGGRHYQRLMTEFILKTMNIETPPSTERNGRTSTAGS